VLVGAKRMSTPRADNDAAVTMLEGRLFEETPAKVLPLLSISPSRLMCEYPF
jgi:hypothetical protein